MRRFTGNSERIGSFFLSKFGQITLDEMLMPSREGLQEIFHWFYDVARSAHPSAWETLFLTPSAEALYRYLVAEFFHNPHLWRSLIHDDDCDRVENRVLTPKGTEFLGEKSFMNYPDFRYAASDGLPNTSETAFKTSQFC